MSTKSIFTTIFLSVALHCQAQIITNEGVSYLMNQPKDMSADFSDLSNTYFFADSLSDFNTQKAEGKVKWNRYRIAPRQSFNTNGFWPQRLQMLDFPETAYDNDPQLKFQVRFVSPRTVRITMLTTPIEPKDNDAEDIMFCGIPKSDKSSWTISETNKTIS